MRSPTGAELSAWVKQLDCQQAELYARTTMRRPTDADLSAWRTQLDRQQEELDLEISRITDVISSGLRRPVLTPSIKRGRPDVDGFKTAISVSNPAVRLQFEGPTRFRTSSPKSEDEDIDFITYRKRRPYQEVDTGAYRPKPAVDAVSKPEINTGAYRSKPEVNTGAYCPKQEFYTGAYRSKPEFNTGAYRPKQEVYAGAYCPKPGVYAEANHDREVYPGVYCPKQEVVDAGLYHPKQDVDARAYRLNQEIYPGAYRPKREMDDGVYEYSHSYGPVPMDTIGVYHPKQEFTGAYCPNQSTYDRKRGLPSHGHITELSHRRKDRSPSNERSPVRRGNPKDLPKNLKYDGFTRWLSFRQKFESYRTVNKWSASESLDYLNWCLEGKALDFFSIHRQQGPNISFIDMMAKLECRFGAKELPETSKAKFQQATQYQNESLEDWADRVLSLAMPAFRDLPEQYCTEEVISRFCQGCLDKEGVKHACLNGPKSMKGAIDLVCHHQYISTAVDGKVSRHKNNSVNAVSSSEDKISRLEKKLDLLMEKMVKEEPSNSSKP
ncbi:hypothetical protein DPMN_180650 [Dreissena polymorpha]|uniref:Paraneoplastic antigen Ma-like C-terminal domain-containing protein n=1 Tax=Dreissena polymorpha TaxID=45954 RepID=A0A9D4EIG2_DREPO|nr:hypothetical protein DPMN_180650 [Dreissena polymorpha]